MAGIRTSSVEYAWNGSTAMGYLAQPAAGTGPGVVVIQEWWGLNPHIRDVAERFAREGFVALAPDLYHGAVAAEPDEARKLAMGLEMPRAVHEITGAARYLKSLDGAAPRKVGVVGWCMGGGLVYASAVAGDEFAAAVAFYGRPPEGDDVARLHAPVLGLFAEHDHGITPEQVRAFDAALERAGQPHTVVLYPGTQHAFFNDTRPVYHAEAAADAWRRTVEWFGRYLR